jgi:ParB family chromosome partitioning protein
MKTNETVADLITTNKTKKTDILKVDPRNIIVMEGFNVREDMGDIEALLNSILAVGLQVPLRGQKVRGQDKFELVEGHRRLKAIMLGIERGHDFQFVELMPFTGNEEDRVFTMLITGTGQKTLNEMEQAIGVKRLITYGYSIEEIGIKILKSVSHVNNLISMTNLPKLVQSKVSEGVISGTTALKIARKEKDVSKQIEIINKGISASTNKSVAGMFKKVTDKDIVGLKKITLEQKISKVIDILKESNIDNDKVKLLHEMSAKNITVEDIVKLFS